MGAVAGSSAALSTRFPGARVLVVDDERSLRTTLSDVLSRVGYQVWAVACGAEALEVLAQREYDVVLLDLKMPDIDGTDVLREARLHAKDTIFIIMTAYGTLESAIIGLRHGAFDYLLKPSSLAHIVQTIEDGLHQRQERHGQKAEDPISLLEQALSTLKSMPEASALRDHADSRFLKAPGLLVDIQKCLVLLNSNPVDLTPTEFDILTYLMRHRARVVSARELVMHLRGYELDEREASDYLRSHVHRLRQKLSPPDGQPQWIETVRGQGFTFLITPTM